MPRCGILTQIGDPGGRALSLSAKAIPQGVASKLEIQVFLVRSAPTSGEPGFSSIGTPLQWETKNTLRAFLLSHVVIPEGVEPSIFWMRTRRPGPLDDGTNTVILSDGSFFCKSIKHGIIYVTFSGINRYESGSNTEWKPSDAIGVSSFQSSSSSLSGIFPPWTAKTQIINR